MFPLRSTVPSKSPPYVVVALILINTAVFVWELGLSGHEMAWLLNHLALVPARWLSDLSDGQPASPAIYAPLLTNTFLHGGWLHLILNMWTLWLFGPAVEDSFGHGRLAVVYLLSAVTASVTHVVFDPSSVLPVLGASGAIAAVLGAYTVLYPTSGIVVLVPLGLIPLFFTVPALFFTGLWLVFQVVGVANTLLMPQGAGGVAWWAHLGGLATGLVLTPLLRRRDRDWRTLGHDQDLLRFLWPGPR